MIIKRRTVVSDVRRNATRASNKTRPVRADGEYTEY